MPTSPQRRATAFALLVLAFAGCSPSREALSQAGAAGPTVPPLTADDVPVPALAVDEALALPENFPDDVYLPSDYRLTSVMDRGGLRVLSLQAPGRVPLLFDAARRAMRDSGWTQTIAVQDAGDTAMLGWEKERRAAVLSLHAGGGGVAMSLQLRESVPLAP